MKYRYLSKIKYAAISFITMISISSCMDYEDINTPDYLPKELPMGAYFIQMQNIVYPAQENNYQMCESLIGDVYGRYMTITNSGWESSFATFNAPDNWLDFPFEKVFSTFYSAWVEVKDRTDAKGVNYAWAQLLRVAAMQRMTDLYGPIPYSKVASGNIEVPYDSQEEVYKNMFNDLDFAISELTAYVLSYPGEKPMEDYDRVYGGDYSKWVKFANSLKLRMAMRIVYANPALAEEKALEAVNHPIGVIRTNEENAYITYAPNPIKIMWEDYTDSRVCADIVTYMKGYNDPRMSKYFQMGNVGGASGYYGLRAGITIPNKAWALTYSAPAIYTDEKLLWMNAAEVSFLKSEGAMRGWNMGGTTAALYNQGIKLSFDQYGVSGNYDTYITNSIAKPAAYDDPTFPEAARSTITIKWEDAVSEEVMLERIITQKWIAMWPLGQEAWSEQRRTGYPRFFPTKVNKNTDASLTTKLAARIPFAPSERINNATNYSAAVSLLGGTDAYGTKIWWDKKSNKP
ncbi:SusD/RagB family nutrient-binding outer membrane lipoprotein [Dysgonomonas sp. Marseille-P4677]|uniref:RagB/SusD family nutrient uptake outer membrane protein n=1 Tax=Dysgonomonas sp. Marseille-P4677 TaxID=2364790 RepID=UPI0019121448|nr:RagB/SusD family nutrient uptake outer membrane protein [Dysgonomonas sp. Marseille-P4677]MBK5722588.1 SusD/RagB family nutrient-binding outer membrane lipoprotein [Dysgonomonas sp. Marseille-P4677]